MWGATGNAIAQAPNLTDLRSPVVGGDNIVFDANGHSAREAPPQELQQLYLSRTATIQDRRASKPLAAVETNGEAASNASLEDLDHLSKVKVPWNVAALHGLKAFWKFFITPTGFLMTIYGLNVVAWGAMLFFLELHAAPAMDHPDDGDHCGSPRRIWLEIDSQILNALFCISAWGLAPWRFRDFYWLCQWRLAKKETSRRAIHKLLAKNDSWFRLRESDMNEEELQQRLTFTGATAPPTKTWKMDFVVLMFVLNSLLQVGMAFFMWHWHYCERPGWGTGTFIGLGCAVSLFAGIMCWWEGRKIKKIEGPKVLKKEVEKV